MNEILIHVPDIGGKGEVTEIFVKPGDNIAKDDPIMTIESDKAAMEVPALEGGTIAEILLSVGDKVEAGMAMLKLATATTTQNTVKEPQKAQTKPSAEAVQSIAKLPKEQVATTQPSPTQASEQIFYLPDIGGTGVATELLVKSGDHFEKDSPLLTVESDKAAMEVPATASGHVSKLLIKIGDEVSEGSAIFEFLAEDATAPSTPTEPAKTAIHSSTETKTTANVPLAASAPADTLSTASPAELAAGKKHAGPAARKLARELGLSLNSIQGTGPKNRILKQDVKAYVAAQQAKTYLAPPASTEMPLPDFSAFGDFETQPMGRIQNIAAQNFQRSWQNLPHVTQFDNADITDLEAFRKEIKSEAAKKQVKLTPLPFLIKAVTRVLEEMPQFLISVDMQGQQVIHKKYIHIGIAVDTPHGLFVPVIHNADQKGILELAMACSDLAEKAKTKKLKPQEMQGSCFTLSSLGSVGGTAFTPIINPPEVAILGISKASIQPVWDGKNFVPRLMLPLSLSYDHRAINGVDAAQFTSYLAQILGDIKRLIL